MLSQKMSQALNHQFNREIYSAYLYLSMAASSETLKLKGFANWFYVQVKEELFHAEKLYKYIIERGNKVILEPIEQPQIDFRSPSDLFEKTLEHEKKVTSMINNLVLLSKTENDNETRIFLEWYVKEQEEEEESAEKNLIKIKSIGHDKDKLLELDEELAKRK